MSFTKKKITLIFTLGQGQFGQTGSNTVTVEGLRVSCQIVKTGSAAMSQANIRIFGLTPTVYNSLASIYPVNLGIQRNTVTVQAGDDVNGIATVFIGQITIAQIDLNSQPDSVMNIVAQTGLLQALTPIQPTSYPMGAAVATAMQSLATQMNLNFENNNVTAILPKSYFPGTARQQALAIVEASGIKWNGGDDGVLAIWKNGSSRGGVIPIISPDTGMIGYPSYSNIGIGVRTSYNPNIQYGGQIQLKSTLQVAHLNGNWQVFGLTHMLESELPDGQWMTEIQGFSIGAANGQ